MIPTLHSVRLTLRPQTMADFPDFAAFMASPRAQFMGGPKERSQAWGWLAPDQAQGSLLGWGGLSVTETAGARLVGQGNMTRPPAFPETEIGWTACEEGQGFLTEAVRAVIGWAFGPRGLTMLVMYANRTDVRAIRMAERLGAVLDAGAVTPSGIDYPDYHFTNRGQHVSH